MRTDPKKEGLLVGGMHMTAVEKRLLIPADALERVALEEALRGQGWELLPYRNAQEAEQVLSGTPPVSVVLLTASGEPAETQFVKTIRRVSPDVFVLQMGDMSAHEHSDARLGSGSKAEDVATAVKFGAAVHEARVTERMLRERLNAIEEQTRIQAQRIHELEEQCASLRAVARTDHELAMRDPLTGLHNRRFFSEAADGAVDHARRAGVRLALAMVDIDHFKHFNDKFGHMAGDQILSYLGRFLVRNLRRMDIIARYGGEEFIFLMPETHKAGDAEFNPFRLIERLRVAIESDKGLNGDRFDIPITISAGVVQYPYDGRTIPELIVAADDRLLRAKQEGRNRVVAE